MTNKKEWSDYRRNSEMKDFGSIFQSILRAYNIEKKYKEYEILSLWEEMMGRGVAVRTDKLVIRNQVLYVKLNSAVMREELLFGKSVIVERVNEYAGYEMIKDVYFE